MRKQLRPFHSPVVLARMYDRTYDHTRWFEHMSRVQRTAEILKAMKPESVADLSCGDAGVVFTASLDCQVYLGDYVPGYEFHGPIEKTVGQIPKVDVFVCSETLEHVERPDALLEAIAVKSSRLVLSTPEGESTDDNPEHYWGWDHNDLHAMLDLAGWDGELELYSPPVENPYYVYQIWKCTRR
jgi:hypothetical protein